MTQLAGRGEVARRDVRPGAGYPVANFARWIAGMFRPPRPAGATAFVPAWRRHAIAIAVAVVVTAAFMLWVDAAAIVAIGRVPDVVRASFDWATGYGRSAWLLVPLGLLVLVAAIADRPGLARRTHLLLAALAARLGFLFVAIALPGIASSILKALIGRARPSSLGPLIFEPFSITYANLSLPSGHACTSFAALVAFGTMFPRLRLLFWAYALVIAVSRLVLTTHYPSDALAGAVLGAVGALMVRDWFARRRLAFSITPDGRIWTHPHPSLKRLKGVARGVLGT